MRSTPLSARRNARRSRMSQTHCSASSSARLSVRELPRTVTRTSSPRPTRARATCDPTRPVAPVTRVTPTERIVVMVPRMPVAVVTDTTHYAPRDLIEDNGIHQVSLYVNEGDDATREIDIADFTGFYDRLRTTTALPTTSQPSIGDFLEVFTPLADAGNDIVSVHLAGGISGTVESARQAAQELMRSHPQRRVEVVDSRKACGALGMAAFAGAAVARAGGDVDKVAARVR